LARGIPAAALRPLGRPIAFHFHGIVERADDPAIQFNHHARDDFYRLAKLLKADFEVLPLHAIDDVLKTPARHHRAAFLMSDDGYRSVATHAADILDALGLPWTLFVSTHHIDSGEWNPFTAARIFFRFAPAGDYTIRHLGSTAMLGDAVSREKAAGRMLRRLRRLDAEKSREAVRAMIAVLPPDRLARLKERFASEDFLNWPQVAELAKRGVEIGAHAHDHWPMHAGCSAESLAGQARVAKSRIENQIGPCRFFAYPVGNTGDVSKAAWQAVRDAGYSHAFTTLAGSLDGGSNPWLLPRYALQAGDAALGALAPLLRIANPRLAFWQRRLA
jgi:peptidoglycan/xylan/chitin deacetylase (PgdA/CDA1 family)